MKNKSSLKKKIKIKNYHKKKGGAAEENAAEENAVTENAAEEKAAEENMDKKYIFIKSISGQSTGYTYTIQTINTSNIEYLKITKIKPNSIEYKAGLKVDDLIISVDDEDISKFKSNNSNQIKYPNFYNYVKSNESYKLTILRKKPEYKIENIDGVIVLNDNIIRELKLCEFNGNMLVLERYKLKKESSKGRLWNGTKNFYLEPGDILLKVNEIVVKKKIMEEGYESTLNYLKSFNDIELKIGHIDSKYNISKITEPFTTSFKLKYNEADKVDKLYNYNNPVPIINSDSLYVAVPDTYSSNYNLKLHSGINEIYGKDLNSILTPALNNLNEKIKKIEVKKGLRSAESVKKELKLSSSQLSQRFTNISEQSPLYVFYTEPGYISWVPGATTAVKLSSALSKTKKGIKSMLYRQGVSDTQFFTVKPGKGNLIISRPLEEGIQVGGRRLVRRTRKKNRKI